MKDVEKKICRKLKEIREILKENGGVEYLAMAIMDDGTIMANNSSWELPPKKSIHIYVSGKK